MQMGERLKFDANQNARLIQLYQYQKFIDGSLARQVAEELGVSLKQIRTWFQNKRAKDRRQAFKASGEVYPLVINFENQAGIMKGSKASPPTRTNTRPLTDITPAISNRLRPSPTSSESDASSILISSLEDSGTFTASSASSHELVAVNQGFQDFSLTRQHASSSPRIESTITQRSVSRKKSTNQSPKMATRSASRNSKEIDLKNSRDLSSQSSTGQSPQMAALSLRCSPNNRNSLLHKSEQKSVHNHLSTSLQETSPKRFPHTHPYHHQLASTSPRSSVTLQGPNSSTLKTSPNFSVIPENIINTGSENKLPDTDLLESYSGQSEPSPPKQLDCDQNNLALGSIGYTAPYYGFLDFAEEGPNSCYIDEATSREIERAKQELTNLKVPDSRTREECSKLVDNAFQDQWSNQNLSATNPININDLEGLPVNFIPLDPSLVCNSSQSPCVWAPDETVWSQRGSEKSHNIASVQFRRRSLLEQQNILYHASSLSCTTSCHSVNRSGNSTSPNWFSEPILEAQQDSELKNNNSVTKNSAANSREMNRNKSPSEYLHIIDLPSQIKPSHVCQNCGKFRMDSVETDLKDSNLLCQEPRANQLGLTQSESQGGVTVDTNNSFKIEQAAAFSHDPSTAEPIKYNLSSLSNSASISQNLLIDQAQGCDIINNEYVPKRIFSNYIQSEIFSNEGLKNFTESPQALGTYQNANAIRSSSGSDQFQGSTANSFSEMQVSNSDPSTVRAFSGHTRHLSRDSAVGSWELQSSVKSYQEPRRISNDSPTECTSKRNKPDPNEHYLGDSEQPSRGPWFYSDMATNVSNNQVNFKQDTDSNLPSTVDSADASFRRERAESTSSVLSLLLDMHDNETNPADSLEDILQYLKSK